VVPRGGSIVTVDRPGSWMEGDGFDSGPAPHGQADPPPKTPFKENRWSPFLAIPESAPKQICHMFFQVLRILNSAPRPFPQVGRSYDPKKPCAIAASGPPASGREMRPNTTRRRRRQQKTPRKGSRLNRTGARADAGVDEAPDHTPTTTITRNPRRVRPARMRAGASTSPRIDRTGRRPTTETVPSAKEEGR